MKYFILYITDQYNVTTEYYLKGKSSNYVVERVERYTDGCLATSKVNINTFNLSSAFVREINPDDFPLISKKDFGIINENKSYNKLDLV
jgi:hypothetical protein